MTPTSSCLGKVEDNDDEEEEEEEEAYNDTEEVDSLGKVKDSDDNEWNLRGETVKLKLRSNCLKTVIMELLPESF